MFKRLFLVFFGTIFSFIFTINLFNFASQQPIGRMTIALTLPKAKVTKAIKNVAKYSQEDYDCLHENIYHEARDQSTVGQAMVGVVTIARTNLPEYPDTICGVVYQSYQFSWTIGKKPVPNLKNTFEAEAWRITGMIAKNLLEHREDIDKDYNGLVFYHTTKIKPFWSKSKDLKKEFVIDDHVFYSKVKNETFSLVLR